MLPCLSHFFNMQPNGVELDPADSEIPGQSRKKGSIPVNYPIMNVHWDCLRPKESCPSEPLVDCAHTKDGGRNRERGQRQRRGM